LEARGDLAGLVNALGTPGARDGAMRALFALTPQALATGGPAAVQPLLDAIEGPDADLQYAVVSVLASCGSEGFDLLVDIASKHEQCRAVAVDVLVAQAGSPQPVDFDDTALRHAIVRIGGDDVARRLADRLRLDNPSVRKRIEEVLVELRSPASVEPLIEALSRSSDERAAAVRILGHLGDVRAVEPLVAALEHDDEWFSVNTGISRALALIGDPRTTDLLLAVISNDGPGRARAIGILGEVGDERAVRGLVDALRRGEPARKALERLTERGFGTDESRQALTAQAARDRVVPLLNAIRDGDRRLVKTRLKEARRVGNAARALLVEFEHDPDEEVRAAARRAIEMLG